MKRILFALLAAALCLSSCMNSKDILYRGSMFGTMSSSSIMLGDDGRTYYFTNTGDFGSEIPTSGRIVAVFDALKLREGTSDVYEAELLNYTVPLSKEPVVCETPEEDEALGDDPLRFTDGTWGGGHLNLLCSAYLRMDSKVSHLINLQLVPGENADTLHTVLRHNAGEDKVTDLNFEFFTEYPFYASFPLEDRIPESGSVILEITWYWDNEWHSICTELKK